MDRWALRDAASPLDFALGGFSQSYEAQYQLIPRNGSLLRVSVFHRSLRNLLVDLQDPQLAPLQAPVVVAAGTLRGAEVELEHWLTRELSAGAWVRVSENSRTGTGGLDIPFQPRLNSEVRLDYLNRSGVRVALVWSHVGSRYANLANTWKRSGFEVVNLSLARQFSLHTDVVLVVDDLLNEGNG